MPLEWADRKKSWKTAWTRQVLPAKKLTACSNVDIKMMPVVRVWRKSYECECANSNPQPWITVGVQSAIASYNPHWSQKPEAKDTQQWVMKWSRSMTLQEPLCYSAWNHTGVADHHSQLVSLLLNPINKQITPAMTNTSPTKSNSWTCCSRVLPWWGLRLRKKNRIAAAAPPVGLVSRKLV
jgi:hypothetical protein